MITINYKRNLLNVTEVYGQRKLEEINANQADLIINTRLLTNPLDGPIVKKNKKNNSFEILIPNFILDLSKEEQDIYNNFNKSIKYEIRKASEKDGLIYSEYENATDEQLLNFSRFFNSFAKEKNIDKCVLEKLFTLRNNDSLLMTVISDEQNNILVAHCMLLDRDNSQSYGLYSVSARFSKSNSSEKRLVGRANKYLHWKEIQTVKQRGFKWYNMGGVVAGKEGEGINEFKMKLGGVRGYDLKIYHSNSFIGNICKTLLYYKWRKNLIE
ncbi:peptidoglycan bridge formation glycyltransferase FemA/FemB family protein [Neobacillus cucumis]|uniref:BioF2-like acetyltransferase domain-containing protein n=1 Tax=Neobacillus cucumis TaxID=1740721 RepID=A0A2N5H6D7_9BACI|nr:peptidoglycan bridge formation glycyltransferase FemA/FemB family protein [Neobacillus cucumis]PLS01097.1 hypothetical protein CVD27_27335 [Neobacillus cucumis]